MENSNTDTQSQTDKKNTDSSELNSTLAEDIQNKNVNSVDGIGYLKESKVYRSSEHRIVENDLHSKTKSVTKTVSPKKSLSFSIERMLNFTPKSKVVKDEKNISTKVISPFPSEPVLLKSNIKKKGDFIHPEKKYSKFSDDRGFDDDNDSNGIDDDEGEEESTLSSPNSLYDASNYSSLREEFSHADFLPVGLNRRPMWPSLFSYLGQQWPDNNRDRYGLIRRVGHPYQNRTPPKRKKPRTAFTRQQVMELEKRFSRQKYLASAERSTLAKGLNMSDSQVKTWFQNRRTKWRRQTAEEREMERQAAKKFLLSIQREETQPLYSPLCATPSGSHFHPGLSRGLDVRYVEQS